MKARSSIIPPAAFVLGLLTTLLAGCSARPESPNPGSRIEMDRDLPEERNFDPSLQVAVDDLGRGTFRERTLARIRILEAGVDALPILTVALGRVPWWSHAYQTFRDLMERIHENLSCEDLAAEARTDSEARRRSAIKVLSKRGAGAVRFLLPFVEEEDVSPETRKAAIVALREITGLYPLLKNKAVAEARRDWARWVERRRSGPEPLVSRAAK